MVDHKPLPDTPAGALSIEGKSHQAELIRHILSEVQDPAIESKQEKWACAVENALDELGICVAQGNWLSGVKKGRKIRRIQRIQTTADTSKEAQGEEVSKTAAVPGTTAALEQLALEQLRQSISRPLPAQGSCVEHLLLCVAQPGSRMTLPQEHNGFTIVPANVGCRFTSGVFSLSSTNDSAILYGLNEWDTNVTSRVVNVRPVGGTFTFQGITSPQQQRLLSEVLRISIYIHLSLLLEQQLFSDANVPLVLSRPVVSTLSLDRPVIEHRHSGDTKPKSRNSILPSGLLSFFTKKGAVRRSSTISPIIGRDGSLDLISQGEQSPRTSNDGVRRFSFMSDPRPSLGRAPRGDPDPPLLSALKRIQISRGLLSTSMGVSFAPPTLIVDLVEKERKEPTRRLKGDERAGLSALLGWDGKDARGKGMTGTLGFIRQQEISVLYSQYVTTTPPEPSQPSTSSPPPMPVQAACGRPRWITYRYYSRDPAEDQSLGEVLTDLVSRSQAPCERQGCQFTCGQHQLRFIHAGVRIVATVSGPPEGDPTTHDDNFVVWESCALCNARSARNDMTDGTYLLSFAKFLELLVYSPALCTVSPELCEHTTPPVRPWPELPQSRLNIIRNFSSQLCTVSFGLSVIEDIFELRVPRLQFTRGGGDTLGRGSVTSRVRNEGINAEEDKKVLRREIKRWWEGVADHMDKLEEILASDDLVAFRKALPRLPSSDDAYDGMEPPKTPQLFSKSWLPPLPQGGSNSPPPTRAPTGSASSGFASDLPSPSVPGKVEPTNLLSSLRQTFHHTEQTLYSQLSRTPVSSLNNIRRSFLSAAKGATKRLLAWQLKHLPVAVKGHFGELSVEEPEWWGKGCHAVPDVNIIVREDDWGSIIAFTMSTADYQTELANMTRTSSPQPPAPASSPTLANPSSFFSAAAGYKLFTSSSRTQPDPDQEDVIWHEPETYSAVISRKEHPRDPASILSIREVLRQKPPTDGSGGLPLSRLANPGSSNLRLTGGIPSSAWAKPDVQISMEAADGEVSGLPESSDSAGKILHDIGSMSADSSRPGSSLSGNFTASSEVDAHIRRKKTSSIISVESDATIGRDSPSASLIAMPQSRPPPLPFKDDIPPMVQRSSSEGQPSSQADTTPSILSFTNTLTSSLNIAMRFVMNNRDAPLLSAPSPKGHHGLLLADASSVDGRPHIKYDWTIGKRLKFSCTVYYARQFDLLRRRCGIEDVFLKSLSRSVNWAAEGGKSKSNFWKTSDDQFIIKTLVNAWNVADLRVLIDLAPSYFRYMDATASKATVLAKLIGFYTIEIRNLETGHIQSKADLLVMENLFHNQKIVKTFDLKGIQGRKVKPGTNPANVLQTSKTLFDNEWIEGQQRTLMLVRPHSKKVLREALKHDAEFLAGSNIMDYSLLLGVDEERKQIACGLVDTIGSYTFAKTLEYKAKHGLTSGKDITVVPPAEYQERFVNALEGYFLACPDKWSKPLDESKIISDPSLLPSVL